MFPWLQHQPTLLIPGLQQMVRILVIIIISIMVLTFVAESGAYLQL